MKVIVTAGEVCDGGDWEAFCSITGLSHWAMNEGLDPDTEYTLTLAQAIKCGLIPEPDRDSHDF
jgi:hypothetical protein